MGYYLRKPPRANSSRKCNPQRTKPTWPVIRGMLVRAKEVAFYIRWVRHGRPKADHKRAERILERWGEEALCSCDVCDVYADATLAALKWVCGESDKL